MIAQTFVGVTSESQFALSDLSVTGYDAYDPKEDEGGTSADFILTTLNSSGRTDQRYAWFDDDEHSAGWYTFAGAELETPASSIKFDIGQAFWCKGTALTLVGAGAVSTNKVVMSTTATGSRGVGNPYPATISLANIKVTGYDPYDPKEDEGGTSADFILTTLTPQGRTDQRYAWFDDDEHVAGWYTFSGGALDKAASEITFPEGQGFWCKGSGLYVSFECPISL